MIRTVIFLLGILFQMRQFLRSFVEYRPHSAAVACNCLDMPFNRPELVAFCENFLFSLTRQQVNRFLVGILSIACVFSGLAIGIFDSWNEIWCGSFIRAGVLLGAFWIGMPTRGRAAAWANVSPWWTVAAVATLVLVVRVVKQPQILIPVVAAFGFLTFVMPLFTQSRSRK